MKKAKAKNHFARHKGTRRFKRQMRGKKGERKNVHLEGVEGDSGS
jgi:hypothetical protein